MEWFSDPQAWIALLTLTALEIVLGIDNIIFISILAGKLPADQQKRGRQIGLLMAMLTRILLLFSLAWLARLTHPIFHIFEHGVSGKDLILIIGGLFLLAKSTVEIHDKLEGEEGEASSKVKASFMAVIVQIMLLDIVFSLDSVITAVGMADQLAVMVIAVIIAVGIMLFASGPISAYVNERPTIKILALSFLLLIGFSLVVEGIHIPIPKGYTYFAMGFSFIVEMLNQRLRTPKERPVKLRQAYSEESSENV
jgi:predicted tellurium resistance membrane protein TerC